MLTSRHPIRLVNSLRRLQPTTTSLLHNRTVVRTFADVDDENARNEWQTFGNIASYQPGNFHILTFNKISPIGMARFPKDRYDIFKAEEAAVAGEKTTTNAHAILLRSHKIQEDEVPHSVRAIAR